MADNLESPNQGPKYLFGNPPEAVFADMSEGVAALRDWGAAWRGNIAHAAKRLTRLGPDIDSLVKQGAPSVVLLPGLWERWEVLTSWGKALDALGFDVHYVPQLDMEFGSLGALAQKLGEYLQDQDLSEVLIVAHSKGGLVAKALMTGEQGWRVGQLIACGTPFVGSPIAALSPAFIRMKSMVPWDQEIVELGKLVEVNERIVALQARWDQNVPADPDLPGATVVTAPVVGHNELLRSPAAIALIARYADRYLATLLEN